MKQNLTTSPKYTYINRFKKNSFIYIVLKYKALLLMMLPTTLFILVNNYLPMFGILIAFKNINYVDGILGSPWVGLTNFYYLFSTQDAWLITRNTVGFNLLFLIMNIVFPVTVAILLNEIRGTLFPKAYQTIMLFPNFISMVLVSYLVFGLLSPENGFMNKVILPFLNIPQVNWYQSTTSWIFIIPLVHLWKSLGISTVIYLAAIAGLNTEYYDAAYIDGATKLQRIRHITLPFLRPTIIILTILGIGKIFNSDFGLFFQVPLQSGTLFPVTQTIDTYVYRALLSNNNISMSSAAGFYQAIVGFILVFVTNLFVRKLDKDSALF